MHKRQYDNSLGFQIRKKNYSNTVEGLYFDTREGHQFGPYKNIQQVKLARLLFVYSLTGRVPESIGVVTKDYTKLMVIEKITLSPPILIYP